MKFQMHEQQNFKRMRLFISGAYLATPRHNERVTLTFGTHSDDSATRLAFGELKSRISNETILRSKYVNCRDSFTKLELPTHGQCCEFGEFFSRQEAFCACIDNTISNSRLLRHSMHTQKASCCGENLPNSQHCCSRSESTSAERWTSK